MAYFKINLNGSDVTNPEDWQNVEVLLTYDNESVQPNISTTEFTCILDAAQKIKSWLNTEGYFYGIPAKFKVIEGNNQVEAFDSYGDFSNLQIVKPNDLNQEWKYALPFKEKNQLDSFMERAEGTTWELLVQDGFITSADFKRVVYVVQKPFDAIEVIILTFTLFTATVQLATATRALAVSAANFAGHLAGGLSGGIGAAAFALASVVANAIYVGVLVVQIVNIINSLLAIFLPYPRFVKALSLRQYMEKACQFLGFTFNSSIPEIDKYLIVPSNNDIVDNNPFNSPVTDTGVFASRDTGYVVGEFFKVCKDLFDAKFLIQGDNVYFESLINDSFWINNATANFQIPSTYVQNRRPNVDEIRGLRLIEFETDERDEWTYINYTGTSYSVITKHQNSLDRRTSMIKGIDRVSIPWALGNDKETTNFVEDFTGAIVRIVQSIARLIPGVRAGRIISAYRHIKDALKVSENTWGLPKLITTQSVSLEGSEYKILESSHRDKLSAKYLYNNYLKNRSFVSDNNRNQWIALGDEISIPFGFSDFVALLNSNYMKNQNGDIVRIESVKWIISQDRALVQYRERRPYDTRLIEEFIEPGK